MLRYTVLKMNKQIPYNRKSDIVQGCTILDESPELIARFDTLDQAQAELSKYKSTVEFVEYTVPYYQITEYCIEVANYDADGEFVSGSDYYFSELPELEY